MIISPKYKWSDRVVQVSKKDLKRTVFKYYDYSPKVIFDIGANIGVYSFLLSKKYPDAKIYSFEPVPENFNNLVKNIKDNNLKNVTPYNFGFYKEDKMMELGIPIIDKKDPRGKGNYRISNDSEKLVNKVLVQLKILDDFVSQNNITEIDILKVDVEGSERDMFKGGMNVLEMTNILHIEFWKENRNMAYFFRNLNFEYVAHYRQNFLFKKGKK